MQLIRNILSELLGLFIDDPLFAVLVIVWVVAARYTAPYQPHIAGMFFFLGLGLLTIGFVYRRAKQRG